MMELISGKDIELISMEVAGYGMTGVFNNTEILISQTSNVCYKPV